MGANPNGSGLIFGIMRDFNLERRSISKSFPMVLRREIGRWFDGTFGSLFGLGLVMTSAIFL